MNPVCSTEAEYMACLRENVLPVLVSRSKKEHQERHYLDLLRLDVTASNYG